MSKCVSEREKKKKRPNESALKENTIVKHTFLSSVVTGPKLTASSQFEVLGCMRMRLLVQPEPDLLSDQRKTQLLRSKRLCEKC